MDREPELDDARKVAGQFFVFEWAKRSQEQRATLGTSELRLLWLLRDREPRTLRQFADQLSLEQSTVNRQVNAAVHSGLLVRDRETLASAYRFSASAKGAAEFERNVEMSMDAYRGALDGLGDRRGEFIELLTEYVAHYRSIVSE